MIIEMSELSKAVKNLKENYHVKYLYQSPTQVIARPLFPEDFGKNNWIWNGSYSNIIAADVQILLAGIWAKELMQATIEHRGRLIAILTTGTALCSDFPVINPNTKITITPRYLVIPEARKTHDKYEFALLGYAIEPEGRRVAPIHYLEEVK